MRVRFFWATDPERDEDGNPYVPPWVTSEWPSGEPIPQNIEEMVQIVRANGASSSMVYDLRAGKRISVDCSYAGCWPSCFEVDPEIKP